MVVGIVGSESAKFTYEGMIAARNVILGLLSPPDVTEVVSGGCHLGGIDEWAAEISREHGLIITEFLPKTRCWEGGYKQRNLQIASRSDIVHCITIDQLPITYTGMRFSFCYHCGTRDHIKSGGCWTMRQAIKIGKSGKLHIVKNMGIIYMSR